MEQQTLLRVMHLVDAMGASEHLWGKERVVTHLMREQRTSGRVTPSLVTFSRGLLTGLIAGEGFAVASLSERGSPGFAQTIERLAERLREHPVDVIHSHGYRANIVSRALRVSGRARGIRLVSTCHGWDAYTMKLRLYHAVDRCTAMLSDVTTVPDSRMLAALPWTARRAHVHNGVPELDPDPNIKAFARPAEFVVGTLGRVTADKGIPELLSAAAAFPDPSVMFTVAGDGDMIGNVQRASSNVRYAGYFARPDLYLAGLDVYVQASRKEGLSLALLEAMRAGKPIVATDVGATRDALTDGASALIVPANRPDALRGAVLALRNDPALAARLGASARARFEAAFRISRQHQRYLELYSETRRAS